MHRQDRRDRVLHGWWIRALARPRTWLSRLERQLRRCPKDAESLLSGACPIVESYGARDRTQRGAAARLARALSANRVEHDVKEYPDAGHSFLNDHHDTLFRMMNVVGIGYHQPSEQDARRRISSFFDAHLKSHDGSETGTIA